MCVGGGGGGGGGCLCVGATDPKIMFEKKTQLPLCDLHQPSCCFAKDFSVTEFLASISY